MDKETELRGLIAQKDAIQKQLIELSVELDALNSTKAFDKGLVDHEGFPRSDLDFGEIASYRNLKRRKAELNNDHLALMKEIQKRLFDLHSTYPKVQTESFDAKKTIQTADFTKKEKPAKQSLDDYKIEYLTPFAIITSVESDSPAYQGGIRSGDMLSQFAEVNIYTMDNIKQIPRFVREGLPVKLVLMRRVDQAEGEKIFLLKDNNHYQRVDLAVVPRQWTGKGLLGCKIDPF